jgi:predicted dithiol-disulfide oxidoreductase (DUF899 family)
MVTVTNPRRSSGSKAAVNVVRSMASKDATAATYSSYARGGEELIGTLMILDRAPKGRNEKTTMDFVRRHDEYEKTPMLHDCCA